MIYTKVSEVSPSVAFRDLANNGIKYITNSTFLTCDSLTVL